MIYLLTSIALLAVSPIIYQRAVSFKYSSLAAERVISFIVMTLVVLHLLPESMVVGGWICIFFAFIGLLAPSYLERLYHNRAEKIHYYTILLGALGLVLHGIFDGAALALPGMLQENEISGLSLAVIVHRLPDGIFICSIFRHYQKFLSYLFLSILGIATTLGFFLGEVVMAMVQDVSYLSYFQAFICGSFLHVGFDRHD